MLVQAWERVLVDPRSVALEATSVQVLCQVALEMTMLLVLLVVLVVQGLCRGTRCWV